ncbi:hypothetical protein GCM10011418_39670 [Sphingobacterium alkalisoli]|nr:hypothetical protein GCM10011418_39670 [Sphingobacterium alkalisoli]
MEWSRIFAFVLLRIGNLVLIAVLAFIIYILITIVIDYPILRPSFIDRYRRVPQIDALLNSRAALSNLFLILFSTIGTLYSILYRVSIDYQLALSAVLLLLFYLIRWHPKPNSGLPTFVYLLVCLFVSSIRISNQQRYDLFNDNWLFVLSLVLSLLFAAGWIVLKIRRVPPRSTTRQWHFSLITVTSVFFIRYFEIALTTINCQYDPIKTNVIYTATVVSIYEPYKEEYHLCLSYPHKGSERNILMRVHPAIYKKAVVGSKIDIHLHTGLLGWPWYHDDIHTRHP